MARDPSFRSTRKYMGPRWLTEGEAGDVGYSLDVVKDAFTRAMELGLLARLPQNDPTGETTAPPDALGKMGQDRRVTRGFAEADTSFAARLPLWLRDRRRSGNPFALMQKLAEYLGPLPSFRTVDTRGNWYSRAANGTETYTLNAGNWDWDARPASQWSRFWVIIYPNGLWTETAYDWGDTAGPGWGESPTGTIGTTATPDQSATVRFLVNDWKPGGTRCVNVIIAFDPASFDPTAPEPDGLWEGWSKNVAGVQVPSRLATARYWDGK